MPTSASRRVWEGLAGYCNLKKDAEPSPLSTRPRLGASDPGLRGPLDNNFFENIRLPPCAGRNTV
jgi:hypothetical protein